jgi:NAD(P)-dependent dehydrogenase (short-subunit alcohol dehydrogenase family)
MLSALINVFAVVGFAAVAFVIVVLLSSGRPAFLRRRGRVSLSGRAIVITGAGSGLGRLIALELCRKCLQVSVLVLLDIDDEGLAMTQRAVGMIGGGPRIVALHCDVSNAEEVHAVLQQARQAVAPLRLSVVVNNAGVVGGKGQVSELRKLSGFVDLSAWRKHTRTVGGPQSRRQWSLMGGCEPLPD